MKSLVMTACFLLIASMAYEEELPREKITQVGLGDYKTIYCVDPKTQKVTRDIETIERYVEGKLVEKHEFWCPEVLEKIKLIRSLRPWEESVRKDRLYKHSTYKDGKLHEKETWTTTEYHSIERYENDVLNGITEDWDGFQLQSQLTYKDNRLHGPSWRYYDYDKAEVGFQVKYLDTYRNGERINRKAYDTNGKLIFDQDYPTAQEINALADGKEEEKGFLGKIWKAISGN